MRSRYSGNFVASALILSATTIITTMWVSLDSALLAQSTLDAKKAQHQSSGSGNAGAIEHAKEKGFDGVDFSYDLFGASPAQNANKAFEQVMKKDVAEKPGVMKQQHQLLHDRYDLSCRTLDGVTMTKGKPQPIGPTVKLPSGLSWDQVGEMGAEDIRKKKTFPPGFDRLPHVKHAVGGQVFPHIQTKEFPRLERFDVEFDLPECILPEFPPPIFLTTHPELGDVSQGEVLTADNFDRLFRGLITPAQLDGLRMLVTQFPQEEFNATSDRKSAKPSLGVSCLDCHVNFHTTGQFHLNPDTRPQLDRLRLDTTSLRGMFNQQIHGSKRSIRSVEDFTEFEQRTAYFNGDPIRAMKKGMNIIDRVPVAHMGQIQNMIDFPPAPHLDPMTGRLDRTKANSKEIQGEDLFFGKAKCVACHLPPAYTDHQMHDFHLERFGATADGPIKTFVLRGIKDSPPYFHDGRLPTLEDTVEFFNVVGNLRLNKEEKSALVAFMRAL
ncbi:cytochrome B6 [Nitrospira sp. KM1]|uniref:cytochrome B6 n=1 Tax=Nitrospira sp. KM1 TaxID=1936990 RepID=UPI0015673A08|nr:cytochrome B6 [Nitrospira sp. KM1]